MKTDGLNSTFAMPVAHLLDAADAVAPVQVAGAADQVAFGEIR